MRQTLIGGSKKMIVDDAMEPTEKIKVYDKGITLDGSSEDASQLRIEYRADDMSAPHTPTAEALQTEVSHFVDCVRKRGADLGRFVWPADRQCARGGVALHRRTGQARRFGDAVPPVRKSAKVTA